jgi:hypothetical protein
MLVNTNASRGQLARNTATSLCGEQLKIEVPASGLDCYFQWFSKNLKISGMLWVITVP